ncbi:hypothetical protein QJS10_CPA08g01710 [Acorus calamus]|uniref:cysteine dioxygenase n=1 Tax=Acorus calamus TaxID=4465 RepID=A0AAV9EC67_ACOCL|nr:hypothetical protein QJS10_CPA08g01710 [Acorus calamus]
MGKESPVQALYELCKTTFATPSMGPATPQAIQKLCSLMDTISPADVGLKEDDYEDDRGHGFFGINLFKNLPSSRAARWSQPITYLHIHECQSFTIGIFCLPTSAVIPLHDHPGMTVLSKILYGSMHVKAYDWTEPACIQRSSEPEYSTEPIIGSPIEEKEENYGWLEEIEPPDDLSIRSGKYRGPTV